MRAVMAGVIRKDGRFLICQRPEGKLLAGKWEFPGGKIEPGETPEEGLARELREELGVEARVGRILDARLEEKSGDFLVLYYDVTLEGEPLMREHADIRFVPREELTQYEYSVADEVVAAKLAAGLL